MKFNEFNIGEDILQAIDDMGYTNPSPMQEETIQYLLDGRDVIGQAQTGTGKTAAFAIPLVENVEANDITQSLILCPTRELCMQVAREVEKLTKYKKRYQGLSPLWWHSNCKANKGLKKRCRNCCRYTR